MAADYWMKLYVELLDDPKMALLPDRLWRRTIEVMLVAKKLGTDGHLPETRQIAWLLRMDAAELQKDLEEITVTGIVIPDGNGWFIPKFAKRQAATTDADRKAHQRDRAKSRQYHDNVTNVSRSVTQSTETEIDTERETERAHPDADAGKWGPPPPPPPAVPEDYDSYTPRQALEVPEIQTFREATGRMPGRPTYGTIIKTIREHRFAADDLKPYWVEWNNRGFRPENLAWLLDWAVSGEIPAKNGAVKSSSGPVYQVIN